VLKPATVITALIVGVVVTLVAALAPAIRAARIPPIAALRETGQERVHSSKVRIALGVVITLAGFLQVISSLGADKPGTALRAAGFGAVLLIIATLVLGPVMARPLTGLIASPLRPLRGFTGQLVRENVMRNPRRTSGAASALLIGVTVVALFSVFAASVKASAQDQVDRSFGGDLVVDSGGFGVGGFNPAFADDIRALPEVDQATGLRFGSMRIDGDDKSVSVVDPSTAEGVFDLDVQQGRLAALHESQVGVSDILAEEKGYKIGTSLDATFPDGFETKVSVAAIYGSQDVAGNWVVGQPAWNPHAVNNSDALIFVNLKDGVSLAAGKQAVEKVAKTYPGAKVRDKDEFAKTAAGFVNQLLALVYVMLTLAIIIALLGIANTLSLSVYERTRELGLLRAVGMTRGQLRSSVRWEAVVVALFGAFGGLGLGVFLGWALVKGAGKGGFTTVRIPPGSLVIVLLLAGIAGVVAGLRAAGKAAKLNVLEAIAAD